MVVMVTAAASVSFFRPEFDDFLYAPIGADRNEMPLSVLSALSRLDVDPWREAAELSELPKGVATQRLASLIARLPGGRWPPADTKTIADRLIELLPHRGSSNAPSAVKGHGLHGMNVSTIVLICAALGVAGLIIAASYERSTRSDDADAPAYSKGPRPKRQYRVHGRTITWPAERRGSFQQIYRSLEVKDREPWIALAYEDGERPDKTREDRACRNQ